MGPPTRGHTRNGGRVSRRAVLAAATAGLAGLAGCLGGGGDEPEHPGGTVVLENRGEAQEAFNVDPVGGAVAEPIDDHRLKGGETAVHERYVTAEPGTAVTLEGWFTFGRDEEKPVEFYPAGADGQPPQVAHMILSDAVSVAWRWETAAGSAE